MTDFVYHDKEIGDWRETNCARPEFSAIKHNRLQLVIRAKEQFFAHSDFSTGPHQTLPFVWLCRELPGKQYLNPSL